MTRDVSDKYKYLLVTTLADQWLKRQTGNDNVDHAMPNTLRTADRAYGMYDNVYHRNARYSRTTKTGLPLEQIVMKEKAEAYLCTEFHCRLQRQR